MLFGNPPTIRVTIRGHAFEIKRAHVGLFLTLEECRMCRDIRGYLKWCGVAVDGPGIELLRAYYALLTLNRPTIPLAFLEPIVTEETAKSKPAAWEYEGRTLVYWLHKIAATYHWSLTEIYALDMDLFFSLMQEIFVQDQLDREWAHSLTELAYPIQPDGRTRKYEPLKRPPWMAFQKPKADKLKVRTDMGMAPVGRVVWPSKTP